MKRVAFIVLVLVLWLATWKGAGPKSPAPDLIRSQMGISVTETTVPASRTPMEILVP